MNIKTIRNQNIAVVDKGNKIADVQSILDIMSSAGYQYNCIGMILYKESLDESFFDLKTGIAGEILQKFSNYSFKLGVVGDFSQYTSKSLKDFIYECNKGNLIYFKNDLDSALSALVPE
ncbi:DUF4180 domain-containing protein [Lacrimispora indolis]|uniref:DUF4180 domain-containing protein n=1 Tax=Lacrimispora indolis TaxID=69825 RepID=UPI00045E78F9|nr:MULTISPECIES: DUF4180 domain-containing protein [Lachnospiraceae]MBE7719915.1 DUF4180 domain-containing protein [Lacrimispora celerecrescens]